MTAFAGISCASAKPAGSSSESARNREYYELRAYRFKKDASHALLDSYLQKAALPALNRAGVKDVGIFSEIEPKETETVFVLIPYASLDQYERVNASLAGDSTLQQAGAEYLQTSKANPGFERIDSWLLRAFAGIPKLELPPFSVEKKPRIFEIRTYESYSEAKAAKKRDMFNDGELDVMRETGLAPVFFGEGLIGADLPHLTYMLSAENQEAHKQHWSVFGKHPKWNQMKDDPQYADTVSKIRNWFVAPTAYSQI
jgi:hypothetical protein